jgi:hypothetical protein
MAARAQAAAPSTVMLEEHLGLVTPVTAVLAAAAAGFSLLV